MPNVLGRTGASSNPILRRGLRPSENDSKSDLRSMHPKKSTQLAVQLLIATTVSTGTFVTVAEISRKVGIPYQNLARIAHRLSRAGFVNAVRGRHGGVRLARPAADIRLGEVIALFERTDCKGDNLIRQAKKAQQREDEIAPVLSVAQNAYISELNRHTLADVARNTSWKRFRI